MSETNIEKRNTQINGLVYESIDELSARTGLPKSWYYARTRTGAIPHIKAGKYLLFIPSVVDAFLANRAE